MNTEGTNRLARHVEGYRGVVCTGIGFGAMANCNERYTPGVAQGYHELTWGVILEFGRPDPHPLMALGQQAIVGSYKLDDVPVGPGKLVTRAAPITGGRTKSEIS